MAQRKSGDDRDRGREPQSYGSNEDWLTGRTDQSVNRTQERTSRHDEGFYEESFREKDSPGDQGGQVSPEQDDNADRTGPKRAAPTSDQPVMKVSPRTGGRSSYFKERDYKPRKS